MSGKTRAQRAGSRRKKASDTAAESAGASPEVADEAVQKLTRENKGLRHRLQAAEEVLGDLGVCCQEASKIALQNRQLRDELESLRAAKQDAEKGTLTSEDATEKTRRPEVDRGAAKHESPGALARPTESPAPTCAGDVKATSGKGRRAEKVTGQRAMSVGSEGRPTPETWPVAQAGLSGTLAEMPVSQVVQTLAATRKTGLLAINSGAPHDRKTGAIYFSDGRIIGCKFERINGVLADQEAFYAMMALAEGPFEFVTEAITFEPRMRAPVQGLLMEAARRQDEQGPEIKQQRATTTRDRSPSMSKLDQTERPDETAKPDGARPKPAGQGAVSEGTKAVPRPVNPRKGAEHDRHGARKARCDDATAPGRITRTRLAQTTRPGVTQAITLDPAKDSSGRGFVTHLHRDRERVKIRERVEAVYRFVSPARPELNRRFYQGRLLDISFEGGRLKGAVPVGVSAKELLSGHVVLKARMALPFVEGPLVIYARVKWTKPFDGSACTLGLSFIDVTNEHLKIIRAFLIGLQSPTRTKFRRRRYRRAKRR